MKANEASIFWRMTNDNRVAEAVVNTTTSESRMRLRDQGYTIEQVTDADMAAARFAWFTVRGFATTTAALEALRMMARIDECEWARKGLAILTDPAR